MTVVDRPDNGQDEPPYCVRMGENCSGVCPGCASGRAGAGEQQRERLIEVMNRHGVPAVGNRAFFAELLSLLGGPQPDGEARQHRMDADCWCQPVQADSGAWDHR